MRSRLSGFLPMHQVMAPGAEGQPSGRDGPEALEAADVSTTGRAQADASDESTPLPGSGDQSAIVRGVYPPVTERTPPGRLIIFVAINAVLLLAASGVLLVRDAVQSSRATPSSPVGATITSQVSLGPGRIVTASDHIVFDQAVSSVHVLVPEPSLGVGRGSFTPRVDSLVIVNGNGDPVVGPPSLGPGASVTVDLPSPTRYVDMIYVAYGTVMPATPPSRKESLVLVTPLMVEPGPSSGTSVHIIGDGILSVGCLGPKSREAACGSKDGRGWTVSDVTTAAVIAHTGQLASP